MTANYAHEWRNLQFSTFNLKLFNRLDQPFEEVGKALEAAMQ